LKTLHKKLRVKASSHHRPGVKRKQAQRNHKFLDTYDHPKLNLEGINDLNRSTTLNEIEAALKSLQK
jgi:hypothetical protein